MIIFAVGYINLLICDINSNMLSLNINSNITNAIIHLDSKYGNLLFYFGITLLWLFHGWYEFVGTPLKLYWSLHSCVCVLALLLFLLRLLLLSPRHPKYVAGSMTVLAILFICAMCSGNHRPFDLFLTIAASRYCNHRKVCFIYLISIIITICLAPVFMGLGLSYDVVKHIGNSVGHSWGINNPNMLAEIYMCGLFAALLYFKIERFSNILVSCWTVALIVWLVTLCRSVVIFLIIFPFLFYFIKKRGIGVGLVYWPLVMLVVSILLGLYFGPVKGDTTIISRFSIPYYIFDLKGVSLFGDRLNPDPGVYIDNYLLHYFLNNGIVAGAMLLLMYSGMIHKMGKKKNHPLFVSMICCVTLLGFLSVMPLDFRRNFMLLFYFDDEEEVG